MPEATTVEGGGSRTLFVSDLDFTLLRRDATLSPRTIDTINRLVAEGMLFTYATARSFSSSRAVTRELRLTLPVITYGGTVTADPDSGEPLRVDFMEAAVVSTILSAAREVGVEPVVFAMEAGRDRIRWHPGRPSAGVQSFVTRREGDPRLLPLDGWDELDPASVFYATLIAERERLAELRVALAEVLAGAAHFLSVDGYTREHWLEIHAAGGTKALAARRLADELRTGRMIAFGDNVNDVPLFGVADESCAVANAVPELRALATRTIPSNDEDGVARWLEECVRG
ncbi:HAD family hydrolase [Micromonospora sp. SL4-19]|uniref:HAD family hydrolase n=1 Tax=Micromonospora sp. SL4-19 TaxID=3399129 RepID=UPI003A4DB279